MGINVNRVRASEAGNQQFSDSEFLEGLRSGNSQTLAALYKKHYPAVLKLILSNSGSEEQARGAPVEEVKPKVVKVALEHHLVSAYTSLVAVDVTPTAPSVPPPERMIPTELGCPRARLRKK